MAAATTLLSTLGARAAPAFGAARLHANGRGAARASSASSGLDANGRGAARASSGSRSLHATDRATLRYVSSTVNVFYETGRATGTLPGWMRVHMRLGAKFTGEYAIETRGGTIRGKGSAIPHGSGAYESFAGTITVSGGTGRFRHAHGRARVYGTFDRVDNQLKVQTTGTLHY
ncbi:MAG: hypothetical protein ACYCUM_01950 [Solirubrobacteraceae bacterium]